VHRDGVGTMISTDFYEGIRPAQQMDLDAIEGLLRPLAQAGVTKARSRANLMQDIHSFTVLERESEVTFEAVASASIAEHVATALVETSLSVLSAFSFDQFSMSDAEGCDRVHQMTPLQFTYNLTAVHSRPQRCPCGALLEITFTCMLGHNCTPAQFSMTLCRFWHACCCKT